MRFKCFAPVFSVLVVAGCVQASPRAGLSATTPVVVPSAAAAIANDGDVVAVSLTAPNEEAAAGISACGVRDHADQVAGAGILSSTNLLPHYVAFTGREPEIQVGGSAFVVRYNGTIRLPLRGGAAYTDAENVTCAVIGGVPRWFLTGPSVDALGNRTEPEPAPLMDRVLPALLP